MKRSATCKTCGRTIRPRATDMTVGSAVRIHYWRAHRDVMLAKRRPDEPAPAKRRAAGPALAKRGAAAPARAKRRAAGPARGKRARSRR